MRRLLHRLALYAFHILVVRPVLFLLVDLHYRRRHLVPEGPCLVVSNHNSHLDAAVLMTLFPMRRLPYVHPVAAAFPYCSPIRLSGQRQLAHRVAGRGRRPRPGQASSSWGIA